MIHYYKNNKSKVTLVLLHGTGADEFDLVPLGLEVHPNANILSLRGRINENGMLRFFKRFDMLNFDQVSIKEEAEHIINFLKEAKKKYQLKELVLLGFSNGASMIEGLLLEDTNLFSKAILLQPGLIRNDVVFPKNEALQVFVSVATNDTYLSLDRQKVLLSALENSYPTTVISHSFGHSIPSKVVSEIRRFLA